MNNGWLLDLDAIAAIVLGEESVDISERSLREVRNCYDFLETSSKERIIYGINTGFGPMAQYRVDDQALNDLQYNIIRSHSAGVGAPLEPVYVRAAMLARLGTFMQARSGVHPGLVALLAGFINKGIYPVIPEHGGVGASGDLVQLAHLGLALIGEGEVLYNGERRPAAEALEQAGLHPFRIRLREGLAITNGTSVMTGIGVVNLLHARNLLGWAVAASVMVNEIVASYDDFMSEGLNASRPHPGQTEIARMMREHAAGSKRMRDRREVLGEKAKDKSQFTHKVQPYYSLRCVPQILGPVWDTLRNAQAVIVAEFNSACDNPIVDHTAGEVYHGGNFHGDYVSFEMDKLKIAVAKMTMLAERQLNYLLNDRINGILPPFVNRGVLGLNYGMQACQFTATSTTAESQTLSNPMYVHSIPNNNDNQDIVSMGTNSALIAARVVENAYQVIAIHLMAIMQAVDCLGIGGELSSRSGEIYRAIRGVSASFIEDTPKHGDIQAIMNHIKSTVK